MVQEGRSNGQTLPFSGDGVRHWGGGSQGSDSQDKSGGHCPGFTGGPRLATVNLQGWAGETEQREPPTPAPR